jgi:hypothetical protein
VILIGFGLKRLSVPRPLVFPLAVLLGFGPMWGRVIWRVIRESDRRDNGTQLG